MTKIVDKAHERLLVFTYFIADFFSAMLAWAVFYIFRKIYIEDSPLSVQEIIKEEKFKIGIIFIPIFWSFLYYLIGFYYQVYRKSRLKELGNELLVTFIGVIVIFFVLLLDDDVKKYSSYYWSVLFLFSIHFISIFSVRFIITSYINKQFQKRKLGFNSLLIGTDEKALSVYQELTKQKNTLGNVFVGFVSEKDSVQNSKLSNYLKNIGNIRDIRHLAEQYKVQEVIIALEHKDQNIILDVVNQLEGLNVKIKMLPDALDILVSRVRIADLYFSPFIEFNNVSLPYWQQSIKRLIDILVSLFVLIIGFPFFVLVALVIKLTSKGPVFYTQERIGRYGKPFRIIKFRSMKTNAETTNPMLSSTNDKRITPFGRFMRKYRIDELPQFINVLKADMSLVGPRPERQYFIEQIVQKAPEYRRLQRVKPGITSLGQVKFGYAENVEQMIDRMRYDLLYIENMSLFLDFKILLYTISTIIKGKGK